MKNFPIEWVIDQDMPEIVKKNTYTGIDINCPVCAKPYKMNINLQKNVCRCNACNSGFNSITLHAKLCGVDNKKAYADLSKRWRGVSSSLKAVYKTTAQSKSKPVEVASLWVRNAIYEEFLDELTLEPKHRENLLKRGLDDATIQYNRYRSVPLKDMNITDVVYRVRSRNAEVDKYFKSHKVYIPGLYDLNNKPMAVGGYSGILIPIVVRIASNDLVEQDYISGFQIRLDEGNKRYVYYTSSMTDKNGKSIYKNGCGFTGCENIHMRLPYPEIDEERGKFKELSLPKVLLTEGALKGDIASHLGNASKDMPVISVLGVSNQGQLVDCLNYLKDTFKTKEIWLCFDEDYVDNENVFKALEHAKDTIKSTGLILNEYHWEYEYYNYGIKGIDDLLLFKKTRKA